MHGTIEKAGEVVANSVENTIDYISDAGKKSWDSVKVIGKSFYDGIIERNENKFNSRSDFINYISFGISEGIVEFFNSSVERAEKLDESFYDFSNWFTLGLVETAEQALFPEEAFSPEHWLNSLGLSTWFYGGTYFKPQTSVLYQIQILL